MKIFLIFFLFAIGENDFLNKRYTYINTDKEWEIELTFYPDSSFVIKDINGCVRMSQKGKWKNGYDKSLSQKVLYLQDTTSVVRNKLFNNKILYSYTSNYDSSNYVSRQEYYFPLIKQDTIYFIDSETLLFRGERFVVSNENLQEKRVKVIEDFYINKIGKEMYIKLLGDGESIEKARENLTKCN